MVRHMMGGRAAILYGAVTDTGKKLMEADGRHGGVPAASGGGCVLSDIPAAQSLPGPGFQRGLGAGAGSLRLFFWQRL